MSQLVLKSTTKIEADMSDKLKFFVKINGTGRIETVIANSHEHAAQRFLLRVARRDLGSRAYKPHVIREGVTDTGANWWRGELWRRARDGNGWVTDDYRAIFTTREVSLES
ncbi:hypothetical protein [Methylobacterium indicum]|uniref:hypothetical protein n=1 Tax=Methylobacterium indicum TaxID=1775910 RepID=UPI002435A100|nr:hypothetical protein [Methylobacterium indicum]